MYRTLSDIDSNDNGKFGIEWDTDCGRYWEWFDTPEERHAVLVKYRREVEEETGEPYDEPSDGMTDVEADADTLKSAGMGTDEDYGYYGNEC